VSQGVFRAPDAIVMHSRRWYWLASSLDGQNRPLVTPEGTSSVTVVATADATAAEGLVGSIAGIPVFVDANLPVNIGAGTNQDTIIVGRFSSAFLWEGALRTRALYEVLSGTLQVRLQVYNYVAFMPDRYAPAFSFINGTGLIAPAGY
jgi:HK97 family phage major capsid protein